MLAKTVGVAGIFSDWPATTTFYATCVEKCSCNSRRRKLRKLRKRKLLFASQPDHGSDCHCSS